MANVIKMTTRFVSRLDSLNRKIYAGERKFYFRFGAYTRIVAKRSIRKRRKKSSPSKPPSGHTGMLRNNIWFAVTPTSVFIGPSSWKGRKLGHLERGGSGLFLSTANFGKYEKRTYETTDFWGRTRERDIPRNRMKRGRFKKRPFMQPAFEYTQRTVMESMLEAAFR